VAGLTRWWIGLLQGGNRRQAPPGTTKHLAGWGLLSPWIGSLGLRLAGRESTFPWRRFIFFAPFAMKSVFQ